MSIYKLIPIEKTKIWGGTQLHSFMKGRFHSAQVAEAWVCSTHAEGECLAETESKLVGTLSSLLLERPELLGEKHINKRSLPIIVKMIDAKENLSIQVHPDCVYSVEHDTLPGKSEFWYVLKAKKGAEIILGLESEIKAENRVGISVEDLVMHHLKHIKTHAGDCFFVPAGVIHSIGAGNLIVEVQEASTLTYRLFDYNRQNREENERPLHIEKALSAMKWGMVGLLSERKWLSCSEAYCEERLCKKDSFYVRKIEIQSCFESEVSTQSFLVLLILSGMCTVSEWSGSSVSAVQGECLFLPAGLGRFRVAGQSVLLAIES